MNLPEGFTDWAKILAPEAVHWEELRARAKLGPKVLIANCAGSDRQVTTLDSVLAAALTLRGADVHILLCDEALPACWMSYSQQIPPERFAQLGPAQALCGECFSTGEKLFRPLGLSMHRYSDFISAEDLTIAQELAEKVAVADIGRFQFEGMDIGEHALAGALRYYTRGDLRDETYGEAILRRYLRAALLTTFAVRGLMRTLRFEVVCGVHGLYVPEGPIGAVASKESVREVCWNEAYRKQTFIFSHGDTYHHTMLVEPTSHWQDMPWTEEMESEVLEYLQSRWYGTHDWIAYTQDWSEDVLSLGEQLGIDFAKPCVGLLTNIIWDAQVHYGGNAFTNMLEWTLETIRYFANRPDLQLIVRIHPAEIRGVRKTRQLMADEIQKAIPDLPKNVFVIPPESQMNTYAVMMKCNAVIIYGTKAGVELSSFGIPVIVAGEAWIRNKGLSMDASSANEYFAILDSLPLKERMSDAAIQQARKYAYHFFFRRMIPWPFLRQNKASSLYNLEIAGIDELGEGFYPGLDTVCNGILKGEEFIYRAEVHSESLSATAKFTSSYAARLSSKFNEKPLISVVVTSSGDPQALAKALDSISAQEGNGQRFDLQIQVVGVAPSQTVLDVVARYKAAQYHEAPPHGSPGTTLNVGLRASSGKYLAFLSENETWMPRRMLDHFPLLEAYPNFGAVYGQVVSTIAERDYLWPEARTAPAGAVFDDFLKRKLVHRAAIIVRRDLFEQTGDFDESLFEMHDDDMFLRLALRVPFAFVSGPVAHAACPEGPELVCPKGGGYKQEIDTMLAKCLDIVANSTDALRLKREATTSWYLDIASKLDEPKQNDTLRAHLLHLIGRHPWVLEETDVYQQCLNYTSKILSRYFHAQPDQFNSQVRTFCAELKTLQKGHPVELKMLMRRFSGDALTQTASLMWDDGHAGAARFLAAYAVRQDVTQVMRHLRAGSARIARSLRLN